VLFVSKFTKLSDFILTISTQDTIGLAFEDRSDLTKEDYKHLKNLGLKFRGKKNWIQFLDYTPGYHPWIITEEQVDLMEVVIEQTMEVAQLLKDDPNLIVDDYVMINHTNDILIRRQVEGKWRNTFIDPERLLNMEEEEDLFFPEQLITYLKDFKQRLPVKDYTLINGFEFISSPIQDDKSQRPYYPRLAFWIDPESEAILTQEMGKEADGIKIIYQPLLGLVDAYKKIPAQIIVSDSLAYDYLYILEEFWGIDIVYDPSDMTAKSIVSQLMSFLG
ncbi:MAG: hypothetical protein AAFP82_13070, partial [Bacteroidota bacterium]